ncbi:glycosyltransferase [Thomasclavelia cocleata]|uniref:glycosyltransferase n=2 Tax=Thomasclavelia cocleata TaxID=69824 RepID=UPI00242EF873|nr:glycosyltransferase [Thomasclavelia cocleata]
MNYKTKDFYIILVIYNKNYHDSKTIQDLNQIKDLDKKNIIVVDNSTKDYNNQNIIKEYGYQYISMNGNKGLPKAYNQGLNKIDKNANLVCLFDDDTAVEKIYFDTALNYINGEEADVYIPVVKDQLGMLSPLIMKNLYCHRVKNIDVLNNENISAINSGMIIKSEVFKNYKYDENLFLDFVDHDFMKSMKKQNRNIVIMKNNMLIQDFSLVSDSGKKAKIRFKILKKDLKYFYRNHPFYYYYVIIRRKLGMCYFQKSILPLIW